MVTRYKVSTYYPNGLRSNVAAFETKRAADIYIEYANCSRSATSQFTRHDARG